MGHCWCDIGVFIIGVCATGSLFVTRVPFLPADRQAREANRAMSDNKKASIMKNPDPNAKP